MLYGGSIIFTIGYMARVAKQDAWLATVMALALALPIVLVGLAAGPRKTNVSMPQWVEDLLGTVVGRIVNCLYLLFFMIKGAVMLRIMIEVIGLAVLPLTPRALILALLAIPAGIAARLGIEVLARSAQIYLIVAMMAFGLLIVGLAPHVDIKNLQPILAEGFGPLLLGSIPTTAMFTLVVIGVWLTPYLQDRQGVSTSVGWSLILIFALVLGSVVYSQGVFTYRGVETMLFPVLTLARSIRIGNIVERLDVVLVGPWVLVNILILGLYVYLASMHVAWVGGTKHYRPFSLPVTALIGILALVIVKSDAQLAEFTSEGSFAPYVLVHTMVIPLVLFVVRLIRGPRHERPARSGDAS